MPAGGRNKFDMETKGHRNTGGHDAPLSVGFNVAIPVKRRLIEAEERAAFISDQLLSVGSFKAVIQDETLYKEEEQTAKIAQILMGKREHFGPYNALLYSLSGEKLSFIAYIPSFFRIYTESAHLPRFQIFRRLLRSVYRYLRLKSLPIYGNFIFRF